MEAVLSCSILGVLCDHHGCLDFRSLREKFSRDFTVDERILKKILFDSGNFSILNEAQQDDGVGPRGPLSPAALVVAKADLRVCSDPSSCSQCQLLHICRYLVCGNCKFGAKCKNPHDLHSVHNSSILKHNNLNFLNEAQLFKLLLQNDPSLIPEICSHYNKGNGEHGSCKFGTSCTSLHICQHFLQEDCKFGAACKRAHTFDAPAMKILSGRGMSLENIQSLGKIYKNKYLLTRSNSKPVCKGVEQNKGRPTSRQHSTNSVSEADSNEICLFFIRKGCSFKGKCVRVHYDFPYKWEILDKDGVTWRHLADQEDIERAYCDPAKDTSLGLQTVDFISMTCGDSPVRRLSTASSISKPPHFILTTEWIWYWKSDEGRWIEYGQGDDGKPLPLFTSKTLENIYLTDDLQEFSFSVSKNNYVLNLKGMYQQNIKFKTQREVRRRPTFVSAQDVKDKLSEPSESPGSSSEVVPAHWNKAALSSSSYTLVELSSSDPHYISISTLFRRTMHMSIIRSIKRVQNPSLWKVFQWQKEQMKKRNGGKEVDQRHLFHGTDPSLIDAICEQNFDWRICGVHGSLYGKGSYFARDAKYSDKYVVLKDGSKMMFAALVLVGDFIIGKSSYVRPPQNSRKSFYDSCVDNFTNPAIFVIFEKYQIYPEYIIEYS